MLVLLKDQLYPRNYTKFRRIKQKRDIKKVKPSGRYGNQTGLSSTSSRYTYREHINYLEKVAIDINQPYTKSY